MEMRMMNDSNSMTLVVSFELQICIASREASRKLNVLGIRDHLCPIWASPAMEK
jgi:hypothetical protein